MSNNADLTAVVDGDVKGLTEALDSATAQMKAFEDGSGSSLKRLDAMFTSVFGNIKGTIGEIKTALTAAAPVVAFNLIEDQLEKGVKAIKAIGDEADKASVSTDFFQTLAFRAREANVDFQKVKAGLDHFAEGLAKLKEDEGDLEKSLKGSHDGLLDQLRDVKNGEEGARIMADAIAKLKSPFDQAALAQRAFGKDARDIFHILNEGQSAFAASAQEAQRYGVFIDEHVIRSTQNAKTGFESVSTVIGARFRVALLDLAPIMQDFSKALAQITNGVGSFYQIFKDNDHASDDALRKRLQLAIEDLKALQAEREKLEAGARGTFDHNVISDWLGLTDENDIKQLDAVNQKITDTMERINELKRVLESRPASQIAPLPPVDEADTSKKEAEGLRMLDELSKRLMTDTHMMYMAIAMDADKEMERFKLALDEKKITQEQYSHAIEMIAADETAKINAEYDKQSVHLKQAMQGLSSEFEKIFDSWRSGHRMTLQQIEKDFVSMIEKMVLKAAILEPLFGTGKAGTNEFGAIGGFAQGLFGSAAGVMAGSQLSSLFSAFKFHEGGIVGDGGQAVLASPGIFAGARRYHSGGIAGLSEGEVPAILQKGETVLPRDAAPGGHTFNINIATPNPQGFAESQGQLAAMLAQTVSRGARNT
jgi:hypothetical protein